MTERFAEVILDTSINKLLDYSIPENLLNSIKPGMRVEVPLRGFFCRGYIFTLKKETKVNPIKPISKIFSEEIRHL